MLNSKILQIMKSLLVVIVLLIASPLFSQNHLRFLIFADLHYDMMPDGDNRLETILQATRKNKVSFIVNMGDLAAPIARYQPLKDKLSQSSVPIYHIIGNHDTDHSGKQAFMDFYAMEKPFYYIDKGKFRFIFLDSNHYIDKDGQTKDYYKRDYVHSKQINRYSPEEMKWLERSLQTQQTCLIFSHAPINDNYGEIINNVDIHKVITTAKANGTAIAAVFGGHIHSDNYHVIDGVHYIQVNSASNIWGGTQFTNTERFPAEVYKQYPALKYIIPYEDALYATVDIYANGKVKIKGTKSNYIPPAPDPEKLKNKPYPCSARILDRKFTYK